MKKTIFLIGTLIMTISLRAQLKTTAICPAFTVDILDGKVNDLSPNATAGEIKTKFPCFTSESASCGGIFYRDKDIYFYPARNYVEIREKFKGRLSVPLMGASRNGLFKWLGLPKIKDVKWDAYQTQYGILILYFSSANRVNKIQFSTKSSETIQLCE
jgi:hypothetical protein